MRSPQLVLTADASTGQALRLAHLAERLLPAMTAGLASPLAGAREPLSDDVSLAPLRVLAVRRREDLLELLPGFAGPNGDPLAGGASYAGPYGEEIVVWLEMPGTAPEAVLLHELAHTVATSSDPAFPHWLSEGFARLWSTARIRGGEVFLGSPPPGTSELLRSQALPPIDDLLAWREGPGSRLLEDEAWLVARWAILGRQEGRTSRIARLAAADVLPLAPGEVRELEGVLRAHLDAGRFTRVPIAAAPDVSRESFSSRRLSAAEVDAALGSFLVHRSRLAAALPYLERALAADPELVVAVEAMGHLRFVEGDDREAIEWFGRAMALGEADELAYEKTVAAVLRVDLSELEPAQVESWLTRAVDRRPRLAPAWVQLAERYVALGKLEAAVSACRHAVVSRPDSPWFRFLLARALRAAGRPEEAREAAREAVAAAVSGADSVAANNLCWYGGVGGFADLVRPACERAVQLRPERGIYRGSRGVVRAIGGDLAGAVEDLRSLLASADPELPGLRDSRRDWLEQLEAGHSPFDAEMLAELAAELPF